MSETFVNFAETQLFVSPSPPGTGTHRTYHPSGTPFEEFDHSDGKHHGRYRRYHPNGTTHVDCVYREGVRDGPFTSWSPERKVTVECQYQAQHDGSSRLVSEYTAYRHRETITYNTTTDSTSPDFQTETRKATSHDGSRTEEHYRAGIRVGVHTTWDGLGRPIREIEYKGGIELAVRTCRYSGDGSRIEAVEIKSTPLRIWSYWHTQSLLGEERETEFWTPTTVRGPTILKVLALNDAKGRNCLLPDTGELTVWKAGKVAVEQTQTVVVTKEIVALNEKITEPPVTTTQLVDRGVYIRLTVPADARRVTPADNDFRYKSRVEFARVDQIVDATGHEFKEAVSFVYGAKPMTYRVGETVRADSFDADPNVECGAGINVHAHRDQCDAWFTRLA